MSGLTRSLAPTKKTFKTLILSRRKTSVSLGEEEVGALRDPDLGGLLTSQSVAAQLPLRQDLDQLIGHLLEHPMVLLLEDPLTSQPQSRRR